MKKKNNNYQISWIVNSFKKEEAEPFDSLALGQPVNALRIMSSDRLQQPELLFQNRETRKEGEREEGEKGGAREQVGTLGRGVWFWKRSYQTLMVVRLERQIGQVLKLGRLT